MDDRLLLEFLQRGVSALERLAEDPVIQMEVGPPACPHCEKMNPRVLIQESEAEGLLAEFVVKARCMHCQNVFYAVPLQWSVTGNVHEVERLISERVELGGFNSNQNS